MNILLRYNLITGDFSRVINQGGIMSSTFKKIHGFLVDLFPDTDAAKGEENKVSQKCRDSVGEHLRVVSLIRETVQDQIDNQGDLSTWRKALEGLLAADLMGAITDDLAKLVAVLPAEPKTLVFDKDLKLFVPIMKAGVISLASFKPLFRERGIGCLKTVRRVHAYGITDETDRAFEYQVQTDYGDDSESCVYALYNLLIESDLDSLADSLF